MNVLNYIIINEFVKKHFVFSNLRRFEKYKLKSSWKLMHKIYPEHLKSVIQSISVNNNVAF